MKTQVVNGRPYYRSTSGTRITILVHVLQKLFFEIQQSFFKYTKELFNLRK